MNCKHCQAELDEGVTLCPACGTENGPQEYEILEETPAAEEMISAEETPAADKKAEPEIKEGAKATPGKIALGVVAVVVVIAILVALIAGGMGGEKTALDSTIAPTAGMIDETVEATEGTIPPDGNPDDVTCKGSYTVDDATAAAAVNDVVATMGNGELTNGELQVYYWTEVFTFLNQYSTYASYFGLDYYQPLDTQVCGLDDTMTWQQYFLMCALETWQSYEAMALEGEAANFQLDAELQAYLETVVDDMEAAAISYGFANAAEMVASNVGAGGSVETYADYVTTYHKGYAYYDSLYTGCAPTADEVTAYFAENEEVYAESEITKDSGVYVDVRHILVMPQGGTTDEQTGETTYSDAEWATCQTSAQAILDEWLAGEKTEDSFAALANTYSEDGGSNTNGGLYEGVYQGQMVPAFDEWCFDTTRAYGNYGLVKTEYGYHIMFYVGSEDIWFATAEADLYNERVAALIPDAIAKYDVQIDYSAIKLGFVEMVSE